MTRLLRLIDRFTDLLGRATAWLVLVMVMATSLIVLLRYGFDLGSIALQESITYMHAAVFMLAAGYTLQQGGHVRVDVFYRRFSPRNKAWVDSLGSLVLLLPFCVFLFGVSWDFVGRSWGIMEASGESDGLPLVYLLKSLLLLLALTLGLQGVGELLRNALRLLDNSPPPPDADTSHPTDSESHAI